MAMGSGIWCMRPIPRSGCGSTTTSSSHRTTQRGLSAFEPHGDADGGTNAMINRLAAIFLHMLLVCQVVLPVPTAVWTQESQPTNPDLIVAVRDGGGALLPGLT